MKYVLFCLLYPFIAFADECELLTPKSCPDHPTHLDDGTTRSWSELEAKVPTIIEDVRRELESYLISLNIDESQRQLMIERVQSVRVKMNFDPKSTGEGLFDPRSLEISMTRGSIRIPSEFSFIQVLAHEMAHSIDPCGLMGKAVQESKTFFPIVQYQGMKESLSAAIDRLPMGSIHQCLLSPESLGVKDAEKQLAEMMKHLGEGPGDVAYFAHPLCQMRRHSEGFCEFMAAEILARYLNSNRAPAKINNIRNGLTNVVAALCHQPNFNRAENPELAFHPSTEDRAKRILLTHPLIREKAGCAMASQFKYCGNVEEMDPPKLAK
jgi:hypothetical protein